MCIFYIIVNRYFVIISIFFLFILINCVLHYVCNVYFFARIYLFPIILIIHGISYVWWIIRIRNIIYFTVDSLTDQLLIGYLNNIRDNNIIYLRLKLNSCVVVIHIILYIYIYKCTYVYVICII